MIKTFGDKDTERLFLEGRSKRVPSEMLDRAIRKLDMIDVAHCVDDLHVPPGNRLHALKGDRAGQYSISINSQWRICFCFEAGDAFDVELCDYH